MAIPSNGTLMYYFESCIFSETKKIEYVASRHYIFICNTIFTTLNYTGMVHMLTCFTRTYNSYVMGWNGSSFFPRMRFLEPPCHAVWKGCLSYQEDKIVESQCPAMITTS